MELYKPPLRQISKTDLFDKREITNDLAEFEFDYFFNGRRLGKSDNIDLTVVTWIRDCDDFLFIRYATYSGQKFKWKEKIIQQLQQIMADINIGVEFAKTQLRYFEVERIKFQKAKEFEKNFLELKHTMKCNIE